MPVDLPALGRMVDRRDGTVDFLFVLQNTKTVFVNNSPGAVQDIQAQLRQALMQGNEVQPTQYKMGP